MTVLESLRQTFRCAVADRRIARFSPAPTGVVAEAEWLELCPVCTAGALPGPFVLEAGHGHRVALVLECRCCHRRWRIADALRVAGGYEYVLQAGG